MNTEHGSYCYQRPSMAQHGWFDIPPSITVCQAPTYSFSDITFAIRHDGWSSHQLAQYLSLLLELPLPSLPTPDGLCNCQSPLSAFWLPSTQLDNFKSPMLWINASALILLFMLKSVLWLLLPWAGCNFFILGLPAGSFKTWCNAVMGFYYFLIILNQQLNFFLQHFPTFLQPTPNFSPNPLQISSKP